MPALGKDLSKIRSHLGLSIQDVQHSTKIPVSTLKSIENGTIFDHPEENQTYIRSFVRSYGRALKIDDDTMIKALDQNETGNYNHLLLQEYPALNPDKTSQPQREEEEETRSESLEEEQAEEAPPEVESGVKSQETVDEESVPEKEPEITETATPQDDVKPKKIETEPSVKSVDWADVGRKFSQEKKHTPVWIVGLIILLIIAVFVGYFLYENGFFDFGNSSPQQQEQVTPQSETTQSSLSLELEDSLADANVSENVPATSSRESASELDEVLQLTIYAANDGLGPVRVWTDMKPRMDPYWLEQGTAMHFEFQDTIRVRGSYPDMILFKDGNLIENAAQEFLQQEENYIQLTRSFFEEDAKWATDVDYELPEGIQPPDSIINRPTF